MHARSAGRLRFLRGLLCRLLQLSISYWLHGPLRRLCFGAMDYATAMPCCRFWGSGWDLAMVLDMHGRSTLWLSAAL